MAHALLSPSLEVSNMTRILLFGLLTTRLCQLDFNRYPRSWTQCIKNSLARVTLHLPSHTKSLTLLGQLQWLTVEFWLLACLTHKSLQWFTHQQLVSPYIHLRSLRSFGWATMQNCQGLSGIPCCCNQGLEPPLPMFPQYLNFSSLKKCSKLLPTCF